MRDRGRGSNYWMPDIEGIQKDTVSGEADVAQEISMNCIGHFIFGHPVQWNKGILGVEVILTI